MTFRKGDLVTYIWYNPYAGTGHAEGLVVRGAKDGKWVDIRFGRHTSRRITDPNHLSMRRAA